MVPRSTGSAYCWGTIGCVWRNNSRSYRSLCLGFHPLRQYMFWCSRKNLVDVVAAGDGQHLPAAHAADEHEPVLVGRFGHRRHQGGAHGVALEDAPEPAAE